MDKSVLVKFNNGDFLVNLTEKIKNRTINGIPFENYKLQAIIEIPEKQSPTCSHIVKGVEIGSVFFPVEFSILKEDSLLSIMNKKQHIHIYSSQVDLIQHNGQIDVENYKYCEYCKKLVLRCNYTRHIFSKKHFKLRSNILENYQYKTESFKENVNDVLND